MPIPELLFEDPDLGRPRQPVPLRLAHLVTGLSFREFVGLLAVRHFGRYEHLTGYEYEHDKKPRVVRREDYADILSKAPSDAPKSDLVALLPADHFVWSDELAGAFSQFIDDCLDRDAAQADGLGLEERREVTQVSNCSRSRWGLYILFRAIPIRRLLKTR